MPFLKCEFVAEGPRAELGQVHTEAYRSSGPGQWQGVTEEFRVPEAARSCWLALEKGTSAPTEIDVRLRDVRLQPIARLTVLQRYRLDPIPPSLEAVRGVHPRIYLNDRRIAQLRSAVTSSHQALWKKVRAQADRAVRSGPPSYVKDDGHSGDEQLWQREVGNTPPLLAMAYVVTGEKPYREAARQWALASRNYKTWGLGRIDGMDLAAGHQLYGLGLVYDWCNRDLDDEARQTIRRTLIKRSSAMYRAAATGSAWWNRSFLQNHLWVNSTGLAVFDEVEEASGWIGLPLTKFRETMAALGPDGASHEGVGYWEYGVEYMLKFADLSRSLLGIELTGNDWWQNTWSYALYLALPRGAWRGDNCIVDLADCPRGHWYGPDYLLRELAHLHHDGHAQWLADQIDRAGVASAEAAWLNLLWFDPGVLPVPPDGLPTRRHFADLGIVSARSGWSGTESLVVFKCGPFLGHQATERFSYDPGGGHVHPDANHFVVFGGGEWLIRDDGYQPKSTSRHNTLLVGGHGQMGEGKQWFDGAELLALKAQPTILHVQSTPPLDHWTGDATTAYALDLGLKRFVRHVLFVKPDTLIDADEIQANREVELELRSHPETEPAPHGNAFLSRGKLASLLLQPLTSDGVQVSLDSVQSAARSGHGSSRMAVVRLLTHRSSWHNAVALPWAPAGTEPAPVSLSREPDRWTFTTARGKFSNIEALARGTHAALAAVEERRNSGFSPRY